MAPDKFGGTVFQTFPEGPPLSFLHVESCQSEFWPLFRSVNLNLRCCCDTSDWAGAFFAHRTTLTIICCLSKFSYTPPSQVERMDSHVQEAYQIGKAHLFKPFTSQVTTVPWCRA